jgi:serine/threonine-protein kinase
MKECPKCELCFADEVNYCPHDQTPTRLTLPGSQLLANRYFIEKRLGRGAMGQVYLARDKNLGTRRVAVKTVRQDILNSEDLQEGEAIVRFEREAMSAASVNHPHIVDVTDFGESAEGVFYLVMEYVEGETLHRLLRREGTLPVKRAVKLLRQIADGVEAAHDAGILHRDLKPANIFIMNKGKSGDGFIKVGDFGLAKIVNATGDRCKLERDAFFARHYRNARIYVARTDAAGTRR